MSQTVITTAFEALKAQQAAANTPVVLDEFVFANVPNLNITDPIDPAEALPTAGQIVHRESVGKTGVVNVNAVVYSITLGADVGDFDFNWVGLMDKTSNTLAMIVHAPLQQKVKNAAGTQGNVLTRSFLMEYDGAKKQTEITTPAGTWQIDFTARLAGMDERQRVENIDVYGNGAFFADGFLVVRAGNNYTIKAGTGYVGGLRAMLAADQALTVATKPVNVWVDTCFTGTLTSIWQVDSAITVANTLTDYVKNDVKHYVFAVAQINADGSVTDLRKIGSNTDDLLAKHIANVNAHPQYAFKNSPVLTGKPTAPTPAQTENSTQLATTEFVHSLLAALVASSPAALDTLKELADALGNDAHFSTTMLNALAGKQPLDNTLNALSNKTVAQLLQYLGLQNVVYQTRKINGQSLDKDIDIPAADTGALAINNNLSDLGSVSAAIEHLSLTDVVRNARKINGQSLDKDINIPASSTGALAISNNLADLQSVSAALANLGLNDVVHNTRKVNGHALSGDVNITAGETGALAVNNNLADLGSKATARQNLNVPQGTDPQLPKAWCRFNGKTGAIVSHSNISSITKNGNGLYDVTFLKNMANTGYAVVGSAINTASPDATWVARIFGSLTRAVSAFNVTVVDNNIDQYADAEVIDVCVFGDLS